MCAGPSLFDKSAKFRVDRNGTYGAEERADPNKDACPMMRSSLFLSFFTATLVACAAADTEEDIESNEGSAETASQQKGGGDFYVYTGEIAQRDESPSMSGVKGVNLPTTQCNGKAVDVCPVSHIAVQGTGIDAETFGRIPARHAVIQGTILKGPVEIFLKATKVFKQTSDVGEASGAYYFATATPSDRCTNAEACRTLKLKKLNPAPTDREIVVQFPDFAPLYKNGARGLDFEGAITAIRDGGGAIVSGKVEKVGGKLSFTPTAVFEKR
jgi:hypothetical protein